MVFVYTENGVEKTSVDENARQNYIDDMNRRLHRSIFGTQTEAPSLLEECNEDSEEEKEEKEEMK